MCPRIFCDFGIPGDSGVSLHNACHDNGVVLYHGAVEDHSAAGNQGVTSDDGEISDLGIASHHSVLCCHGILKNPALSILAEIVFSLDVATQVALVYGFSHIPQRLDTVEPGVLWVGDGRDEVFFLYRSLPRSLLDLAGIFFDSSVSTYSLMISRAAS